MLRSDVLPAAILGARREARGASVRARGAGFASRRRERRCGSFLLHAGAVVLAMALAVKPAAAQEAPPRNFVALGPAVAPDFLGSKDYEAVPLLLGNVELGSSRLELEGFGARLDVSGFVSEGGRFDYGPALRYQPGRDDVDDRQVGALPDVDDSVELGGFLRFGGPLGVYTADEGFLRLDVLADVADGHGGVIGTISGEYTVRPDPRLGLSGLVSTSVASDDYADAFFSISDQGAAASGFRPFDADGGVRDVSAAVIATWAFSREWGVVAVGRVTRLVGDAADSPVVDEGGDATQLFGGLALSYAF
jgi:outer membrane scaffolding protein for murein synthesis (MipA/OmpV family)